MIDGTVSWRELLAEAEDRLRRAGSPTAAIDARRIVEEASGRDGAAMLLALDDPVTERGIAAFDGMVARRAGGEPLQYVVGRWGFRHLDLAVDRRALIPRPETEVLVDLALAEVDRLLAEPGRDEPVLVVDLGTGTGAIGLSVAAERPRTAVWATDRSSDALSLARANLAGIGRAGARVRLGAGEWFAALDPDLMGSVDVVVSNPPYVCDGDELPAEVADWEPAMALRSGPDGLDDLRHITGEVERWLRPGGAFVVELDPRQAGTVAGWLTAGGFAEVAVVADLAGRDRFVRGRRGR